MVCRRQSMIGARRQQDYKKGQRRPSLVGLEKEVHRRPSLTGVEKEGTR